MIANQQRQALQLEKARQNAMRQAAKEATLRDRRQKQDYASAREAEAEDQTRETQAHVDSLSTILRDVLGSNPALDFEKLKKRAIYPRFDARGSDVPEQPLDPSAYSLPPLTFLEKIVPFLVEKHRKRVEELDALFASDSESFRKREEARLQRLSLLKQQYDTAQRSIDIDVAAQNDEIASFAKGFSEHEQAAVIEYFSMVFDQDDLHDDLPVFVRVAYVPDSKRLVIERELPTLSSMPLQVSFRYVKKSDEITSTARKAADLKSLYSSVLAQIVLRTLWVAMKADTADSVSTIVVNAFVDTIDPATGNRVKPTLISVSSTKEALAEISFANVDPSACLKNLRAVVSANAQELLPVRPIVSFDMVDRRFIEKTDVLDELESRPNLAELSPSEFESLMTNLFEKMGLETRLTQASRDGGVDCVAWDMRPVVGGKVVIQAKRYRNTVGVAAVRDLYGTMMNEGAAKGILVTTSGYGSTAFEFAKNKPIELISGSNLLSMLEEYAGVKARIDFPTEWHDPSAGYESTEPSIAQAH